MSAKDTYYVVVNNEEQYSIWRSDQPIPDGWRSLGNPRSRDASLDEIERLWTDMRPASVRRWMDDRET